MPGEDILSRHFYVWPISRERAERDKLAPILLLPEIDPMSSLPPFAPLAAALPDTVPFVGPEQMERERGRAFVARLGANELTLPPSPHVAEAIRQGAEEARWYPDSTNHALRHALAAHFGYDPADVLVGEGIDGILGLVARLFLAPGSVAVTSHGAYPTFNYHVAGFGGVLETVPYHQDREHPAALAERARATDARLVYLSNPDNPMGSWVSHAEIDALAAAVPPTCLVLLDEAYAEFHTDPEAITPPGYRRPNVLRLRTFSKAYGLAGMRVGCAIGHPDLIAGFDRIRNHFGVSRLSQQAALAALEDTAHLAGVIEQVSAARQRLGDIARASGLEPLPSATNFVTIDCGRDGDYARAVMREMLSRDIFVRMPGVAPLDRCIRITAGTAEELDRVGDALPDALAAAAG